jgi:hypothetical protein
MIYRGGFFFLDVYFPLVFFFGGAGFGVSTLCSRAIFVAAHFT